MDSGVFWRNSMVLPGRNTLKTALAYMPKRWENVDSRGNGAYRTEDRWWADIQIATDSARKLSYSASIGALQENLGDWATPRPLASPIVRVTGSHSTWT